DYSLKKSFGDNNSLIAKIPSLNRISSHIFQLWKMQTRSSPRCDIGGQKETLIRTLVIRRSLASKKVPEERAVWSNKWQFLMVCIANSVGLGRPMYYFEMAIGQFCSRSSIKMYNVCPLFRGVGVGQIVATFCLCTYYASLIALTLFYLIASFASDLPWSRCKESWGSDCVDSIEQFTQINRIHNSSRAVGVSSSQKDYVLKEKMDISDGIGDPDWKLTMCLFGAWVVAFLVIIKGVKSSGKASYFLALFPYVIMAILLVRASTLTGAGKGVIYFIEPQWKELLNPMVWKEAIIQLFFSLGVSFGPIVMYASYNPFDHNIHRDAMIVTSIDTLTSLIGGFTIFAILGNLAHNLGIENVGEVVKSGTGLAFISYPDAISKFDIVPQVFSVLFFFMLFVLGIGCLIALQSAIVTVICDQFHFKFWTVALSTCAVEFLLGLIYTCPGGQWMLALIDHFGGTLIVFPLAICEVIAVFWVYGLENFCWDLQYMTGKPVSYYWRICWGVITPVLMITIFIYSAFSIKPLTYSKLNYPGEYLAAGWTIFAFGVFQFPIWAIYEIMRKSDKSMWMAIKESIKPIDWGPSDSVKRDEWNQFKQEAKERRDKQVETSGHSYWKKKFFILLGIYET
ncbi:Sodium-dependent nutrient amino acid transporter 1, partial [Pseudolycoriella hygida]